MVNLISSIVFFITFLFNYASSASELTRSDEKYFFEMNGERYLMVHKFICDMMWICFTNKKSTYQDNYMACTRLM